MAARTGERPQERPRKEVHEVFVLILGLDELKDFLILVYDLAGNLEKKIRKKHKPVPLFSMARKGRLYCFREKESRFKEIAVYRMEWH